MFTIASVAAATAAIPPPDIFINVSAARMKSPKGWVEPGQTPEFSEFTLVLRGTLRVATREGHEDLRAGEAVITRPGEWVRYSTPLEETEYVAVCLPAFSPDTVHRDA